MAMGSVIAVNVWKGIPFFTLLLLAGLKAIDSEQLEAAEVDGANVVQRFRHVTLPGLQLRHHRRAAAVVHLDLQPVRPDLPDDRRRAGRRDQALFDPRLREGDRLAAVRAGQRHRAQRRAADGDPDLAARAGSCATTSAPAATGSKPSIGDRIWRAVRRGSSASCSTSSSGRSTCSTAASRRSSGRAHGRCAGSANEPMLKQAGARARRHRHAAAHPAPDHDLRALPVLLGDRHLVQDRRRRSAQRPRSSGPIRSRSSSTDSLLFEYAVPDLARQLGARRGGQHGHLGRASRRSPPTRCRG